MTEALFEKLARILADIGVGELARIETLTGGCVADVRKLTLTEGKSLVAKIGSIGDGLDREAAALALLEQQGSAPVPKVLFAEDDLLLMRYVENHGVINAAVERHAATVLSSLHTATHPRYGRDCDGRIGPLKQINTWSEKWVPFFIEHRFLYAVECAREHGGLDAAQTLEAQRFATRLDGLLDEPGQPSLLHGDLWGGNILTDGTRVTGLIDPAVYYGDAEMDLAFATLFQSLGESFLEAYETYRAFDRKAFFDLRRDIYNLWPLLVHTALFGGAYGSAAMAIIRRYA